MSKMTTPHHVHSYTYRHYVPVRKSLTCCKDTCDGGDSHASDLVIPKVICCVLNPKRRIIENAGLRFFEFYEAPSDEESDDSESTSCQTGVTPICSPEKATKARLTGKKARRNKKVDIKQKMDASKIRELLRLPQTLYQLLDLEDGALPDEIKRSYRMKVLTTHPDKIKGKAKMTEEQLEIARQKFIKIQEAYEVLSDPEVKRQYDSGLPFDVDLPSMANIQGNFYVLGPLFHKWARFSAAQPVPSLGDESTEITAVKAFYNFWYSFVSTRDYSQHDEHDLKDAGYREERMWMENENKKLRHEFERKDNLKFKELLTVAEKNDPRLRAESKRLAAVAEQDKKDREARDRAAKAEEAARRLEQEQMYIKAQQKEELERQERLDAVQRKEELLKVTVCEIKNIMKSRKLNFSVVHPVDIEGMIERDNWSLSKVEELKMYCDEIDSNEGLEAYLYAQYQSFKDKEKRREEERLEKRKKELEKKPVIKGAIWTQEELLLMSKAINKFPGGTTDRWAQVANFIGTKSQKDVLAKAQELCKGKSLSALSTMKIGETDSISKSKIKTVATNSPDIDYDKQNMTDPDAWTAEQQKQMQAAMKEFPASLPAKERWVKIGQAVEGKTAKQCLERFKEIKSKLASEKK